jgi:hypothetical protein
MSQLKNTPISSNTSPLKSYLRQRTNKNLMQKLNIDLDDSQEQISSIKVIYHANQNVVRHSHDENKYRNRLVDRRFALLRTMKSSNGFMSINTPIDKAEVIAQPSFIFANEKNIVEAQLDSSKFMRSIKSGMTSSSKQAASDINSTNRTYFR